MTFAATILTHQSQKPLSVRGGVGEGRSVLEAGASSRMSYTHPSIPSLKGGEV